MWGQRCAHTRTHTHMLAARDPVTNRAAVPRVSQRPGERPGVMCTYRHTLSFLHRDPEGETKAAPHGEAHWPERPPTQSPGELTRTKRHKVRGAGWPWNPGDAAPQATDAAAELHLHPSSSTPLTPAQREGHGPVLTAHLPLDPCRGTLNPTQRQLAECSLSQKAPSGLVTEGTAELRHLVGEATDSLEGVGRGAGRQRGCAELSRLRPVPWLLPQSASLSPLISTPVLP